MAEKRKKSAKGTVVVQQFRERLRLCWTFERKRLYLYLGLPDSAANRKVAEMRARQIELDISSGNFDHTLVKYKPQSQQPATLTICSLFEQFIDYKRPRMDERSLEAYQAVKGHISQFFGIRSAAETGEAQAEKFADWLGKKVSKSTQKTYVGLLKSAWVWGRKRKLVVENPWEDIQIKIPPKQGPRPFTTEEIEKILAGFQNHPRYAHYADFVEFLLGTGCRTGEAIGLQWQHLSEDCSAVWIGESVSRGKRKPTKTNKARIFGLPPRLQQMLKARKPSDCKPESLVFPSPQGRAIRDHNFRVRPWKKTLEKVGVDYRKPYTTRSTFESHAIITHGMNPKIVADITGHDPKTLFKHYLGRTGDLQAPDIISGKA